MFRAVNRPLLAAMEKPIAVVVPQRLMATVLPIPARMSLPPKVVMRKAVGQMITEHRSDQLFAQDILHLHNSDLVFLHPQVSGGFDADLAAASHNNLIRRLDLAQHNDPPIIYKVI